MTRNQIEYVKLLETRRSNLRGEELTASRDTLAAEAKRVELQEAARHNLATEALTGRNLDIQRASLDETTRHNKSTEQIGRGTLAESTRHNQAQEVETRRHNTETEGLQRISLDETGRHNLVTEGETRRHNLVGEVSDASRIALDTATREQQLAETKRHNLAMELKDFSTKVNVNSSPSVVVPSTGPSSGTSTRTLDSGLPSGDTVGYERDPMLSKVPPSEKYGQFYMSRELADGKRHLMYAYDVNGIRGWAPVQESSDGRHYIVMRNGKRLTVG